MGRERVLGTVQCSLIRKPLDRNIFIAAALVKVEWSGCSIGVIGIGGVAGTNEWSLRGVSENQVTVTISCAEEFVFRIQDDGSR